MKITELNEGELAYVSQIGGNTKFLNKMIAIGLISGCRVKVLKNEPKHPILIHCRDTMLALNRKDSSNITVEVVK